MKKRVVSLLLTMVLTLCCASLTALANGKCGDNVYWSLDSSGTLTISGTGDMYNFYNGTPWDSEKSRIQKVVILEGVISVGDYSFRECSVIETVHFPKSLNGIGAFAFQHCDSLKKVAIPEGVEWIGFAAFNSCDSLAEVIISEGVEDMDDYAFYACRSLQKVHLPKSLTRIYYQVFNLSENMRDIYYAGSRQDWEQIEIDPDNTVLNNATIHYNSSTSTPGFSPTPQQGIGPGSIIKQVFHTDIRAYIDGHPVRSYNIDGFTAIVAEDLSLYGFKVVYKDDVRSLYIEEGDKINRSVYQHTSGWGAVGTKAMDVYYTDIITYSYGYPIPGYNVNGYTVIFIEDLTAFGTCYWDAVNRTISFNRY